MTEIASELHRLLDQLTRAFKIARSTITQERGRPSAATPVSCANFSLTSLSRPVISVKRRFEVAARLDQLSKERGTQANEPVADARLGCSPLRFCLLKKALCNLLCGVDVAVLKLQRYWP